MFRRAVAFVLIAMAPLLTVGAASAQASGPVYIVQPGDSLSSIAASFNVSLDALMQSNGITDPDRLAVGQELIIPGLEGITGVLDTEYINFGDTYTGLLRRTQIPQDLLTRLNHLVSPTEFYVGARMIIPAAQSESQSMQRFTPSAGETLFEQAVRHDTDVWTLTRLNQLAGTWASLSGDVLFARGGSTDEPASGLPSAFLSAEFRDLPIRQGGTAVITVKTQTGVTLGGVLVDHELHFFAGDSGNQIAIQGLHALLEPGVYPVRLDADTPDGTRQSFEQMVLIISGNYSPEVIPVNDPATIDPAVTEPELARVSAVVSSSTATRLWQGIFQIPVAPPGRGCIKDWFGRPRTYLAQGTDLQLSGFHSGVDFGICSETNPFDIYAAASGIVVFAGPLTVRGNATIIDHGWGIFTGYWHQEEIYVNVGDTVQAGQLIGKIGDTGRVTGPHLHWEVWANGVQVDPLDWLDQVYP